MLSDSEMNDMVEIKTVTGRIESGELIDVNPSYLHNYGKYMPEIQEIDRIVKSTLFGGDYYE